MVEWSNKVWVFGGFGDAKGRFNDLRSYDLITHRWQEIRYTGEGPQPIYLHSACVYKDEMWIFGGSIGKDSNQLYRYKFQTSTWTRVLPNQANPTVPPPRYGHAACVLGDSMIVTGGCKQSNQYFTDSWIYDFPSNTWRRSTDLPLDIAYHSMVAYHDDRIILIGGYNGVRFNSCIYSFTLDRIDNDHPFPSFDQPPWHQISTTAKPSPTVPQAPPPSCGAAVVIANDSLFTFAGYTASGHGNDLYKLNLLTREWSVVDVVLASRPVPRAYLQSILSRDGHLIIFGGYDGSKCVSDFRQIRVMIPQINLLTMIREMTPNTVAQVAMRHFAKHNQYQPNPFGQQIPTMDETQLEAMIENIKHNLHTYDRTHQAAQPAAAAASSSSSASASSSSSSALYPFDISHLPNLLELGFSRDDCLECLDQMHSRGQDTSNFQLVVEKLLVFEPKPKAVKVTPPQTPRRVSTAATTPAIPPRPAPAAVSAALQTPTANNASATISPTDSGLTSPSIQPPSSNSASLQEQVNRLTSEISEMRTCKVCFEANIDCVLIPCGQGNTHAHAHARHNRTHSTVRKCRGVS